MYDGERGGGERKEGRQKGREKEKERKEEKQKGREKENKRVSFKQILHIQISTKGSDAHKYIHTNRYTDIFLNCEITSGCLVLF